jgi:hypothetical protein
LTLAKVPIELKTAMTFLARLVSQQQQQQQESLRAG